MMSEEDDKLTETCMDFINEQVKGVQLPPKESLWGRVGKWFSGQGKESPKSADADASKKEHQS